MPSIGNMWPWKQVVTNPEDLARGAKFVINKGMDYVFYYGPYIYKESPNYYPDVEKDWLLRYWAAGLPKHNAHMYFYLNAFPYTTGASRMVGPESDSNSYLGFWIG
jgi:hypothetical protein